MYEYNNFTVFLHIKKTHSPMAKKKATRKPATTDTKTNLHEMLSNKHFDFILGLILCLSSLFIAISFASYINTGAADQSILENLRPNEWLNESNIFANCCASAGAIISYYFITLSFGLPAFFIPAFMFISSLQLMRAYTLNLKKWLFYFTIMMVWMSVAFAKFLTPIMRGSFYNPGGNHGLYCVQRLENVIGTPGLTITLILTAIIFMTFVSARTIDLIRKLMNPVKYRASKVKVTVTNSMEANANDNMSYDMQEERHDADGNNDADDAENSKVEKTKQAEGPLAVIDLTDFKDEKPVPSTSTKATSTQEKPTQTKPSADTSATNTEAGLVVEVAKQEQKANAATLNNSYDINTPINPKEPFTSYKYPTLNLLKKYDTNGNPTVDMDEIKSNNARIVEVLNSFGVSIKEIKATVGPTITLYEVTPAEGVRISKIRNLEDDIALSLRALGVRIIAPIPGKGTVGIEVPNQKKQIVSMESILNSRKFQECKFELPIALGKTITNDVYIADLAKMPHLLVAGATGQGKSVGLNAIITSLLYKKHPNEMKLVLVDPKKVEFSVYNPIANHFMAALEENYDEPIITDTSKVVKTLNGLCGLMDNRYMLLKEAGARNIKEYNEKYLNHKLNPEKGHDFMPYIVVIIDEFGDLIMTAGKDIERPIARIAQLARAVGIHMIIATQRPTTNIITGTIKANFPARMAFRVSAMIDSRTILDRPGANQLIGKGDMLILNNGSEPVRVQCAFVDTPEVERINAFISSQVGPVEPLDIPEPVNPDGDQTASGGASSDIGSLDPYFEEAARSVVSTQQGSTSMIQRRYAIGYNRAGRLMDQLEKAGIVGTAQGSKPREVLISDENQLNTLLASLKR